MARDLGSLKILTPRLLLRPTQMADFEGWASFVTQIKESLNNGTPIPAYAVRHDWHWDLKKDVRQALAAKL